MSFMKNTPAGKLHFAFTAALDHPVYLHLSDWTNFKDIMLLSQIHTNNKQLY